MKWWLLFLAIGFAGCASPCDRLAESTCITQGEGSAACKEIRVMVGKASDEDQDHCRAALTILAGGGS